MDRDLAPAYRTIRDTLEAELDALGFRLDADTYHYSSFGSAQAEYHRRGLRLRLTWDGKDRWAWVVYAAQPTSAFPDPRSYRDLDSGECGRSAFGPSLTSEAEVVGRARELVERIRSVAAGKNPRRRAV